MAFDSRITVATFQGDRMDLTKQHPAYLWVGSRKQTTKQAENHLKQVWCSLECTGCRICSAITSRRYYLLRWLVPEKQSYTVEQIQNVIRLLSFAMAPDEHCYIVFEYAEMFLPAAAHILLKSLEEPSQGYHFILLTQSLEALLPTLISRCLVYKVEESQTTDPRSHFLSFFQTTESVDWQAFTETLERDMPSEHDTRPLLEMIIAYWLERHRAYLQALKTQEAQRAQKKVLILQEMLTCLPLPGSGKFFWRTLFARISLS